MEFSLGDDNKAPILGVVENIIFTDNLMTKLKASLVVINSLDDKVSSKVGAPQMKVIITDLFKDHKFMRRLLMVSTIKSNVETALEYTGFDYINHPDFMYDEEFENKMLSIEKKLSEFLGKLLRELNKSGGIEL